MATGPKTRQTITKRAKAKGFIFKHKGKEMSKGTKEAQKSKMLWDEAQKRKKTKAKAKKKK